MWVDGVLAVRGAHTFTELVDHAVDVDHGAAVGGEERQQRERSPARHVPGRAAHLDRPEDPESGLGHVWLEASPRTDLFIDR